MSGSASSAPTSRRISASVLTAPWSAGGHTPADGKRQKNSLKRCDLAMRYKPDDLGAREGTKDKPSVPLLERSAKRQPLCALKRRRKEGDMRQIARRTGRGTAPLRSRSGSAVRPRPPARSAARSGSESPSPSPLLLPHHHLHLRPCGPHCRRRLLQLQRRRCHQATTQGGTSSSLCARSRQDLAQARPSARQSAQGRRRRAGA